MTDLSADRSSADERLEDDALAAAALAMAARRGLDGDLALALLGRERAPADLDPEPPASPDELGHRFERSLGKGHPDGGRKRSGAFYTPRELAQAVADHALRASSERELPRLIDPAAGSGAFLLAALRHLRRRHGEDATPTILESVLHGIELDPRAAQLCRLCLWLCCADPKLDAAPFEAAIRVGDALRDEPPRDEFDLVIGNPPWEIKKPDSRAFFSRFDPGFRRLPKQRALRRQQELFDADPSIASAWQAELVAHQRFRAFCVERFRLQGSSGDPNLYKLFVERGLELCREGGRLAMLVPAGLHADLGARQLRRALLEEHHWLGIYGFENRARLFAEVDSRFKFDLLSVQKGGRCERFEAKFMQQDPACLDAGSPGGLRLSPGQVRRLSPRSLALPELRCDGELALLDKMQRRGVALGDDGPAGWRIGFRRELDLTTDSARFVAREALQDRGLLADQHGRWLAFDGPVARTFDPLDPEVLPLRDGGVVAVAAVREVWLPLHEGRMVEAFDDAAKGWVEGHGRRALWQTRDRVPRLAPQYLVRREELPRVDPRPRAPKVGFLAVGSATNARSMLATTLLRSVCGNSVPVLRSARSGHAELLLCAVLNSISYDRALRIRLAGNNLNRFALDETSLPRPEALLAVPSLPVVIAALCWREPRFAEGWLDLRERMPAGAGWRSCWAIDPLTRLRWRSALEAIVASAYGLDSGELAWIAADCWRPIAQLRDRQATRALDPKGLWRVDRDRPPQQRLPVLAVAALQAFERRLAGSDRDWSQQAESFLGDWQLPAAIDLAELGFDAAPAGATELARPTPRPPASRDPNDWTCCAVEARRARAFDD